MLDFCNLHAMNMNTQHKNHVEVKITTHTHTELMTKFFFLFV